MKPARWLADYGMILVLVLLCALFSVLTYTEQSPTGEAAARQVVDAVLKAVPAGARVLVVASDQPEDSGFAARVERDLKASGAEVLVSVTGEPRNAREALQRLQADGGALQAVAATRVAGGWRVFAGL
ncbi:MAG: ABC transporter permease, partial [Verrucomicrobiota bacterium]